MKPYEFYYSVTMKWLLLYILANIFLIYIPNINGDQCTIKNEEKLDCYPDSATNPDKCRSRECCWQIPTVEDRAMYGLNASVNIPYCFFPTTYSTYQVTNFAKTDRGFKLTMLRNKVSYSPKDALMLDVNIIYETNDRIHIKLTDPRRNRYQVPIVLNPPDKTPPTNPNYEVLVSSSGDFKLEIRRKSDNVSLIKLVGPLIYSMQFIQVAMKVPVNKGYGIGEQNVNLLHNFTSQWKRMGFWNRDNPIGTNINLYGTHPFFMGLPDNGKAFGLYFHNSNAQEFVTQPSILTYRTIGGILDMFVFTGGSPSQTVQQYTQLIGRPTLQPFWALGFHLCRYGYKNLSHIENTLQRNLKAKFPVEAQWSDIDYMDAYRDFTYDKTKYAGMGDFIKKLQAQYNMKYVVILDAGISNRNPDTYPPLKEGLDMEVFVISSQTGKPLEGKVWPGTTFYPDFTHPNITAYWIKQFQRMLNAIPVNGIWIDMNEPSNFVAGSSIGCSGSPLNFPGFMPVIRDNSLIMKTLCPQSLHFNLIPHYDLHNIYGYGNAVATNKALSAINKNERTFILSRSTFSGSGVYTSHWTGDNSATWEQLANSIRQVLNFNMYGIPMVGADICGFLGNTNEELCTRWMQLGAFYPFMRNHNDMNAADQDPAVWSQKAQTIMREAIYLRYSMSPYSYTLHARSHLYGETVARPLSFEFPDDVVTHPLEHQFMLGPSILVSPAVSQGQTNVNAYFPSGLWYDFKTGQTVSNSTKGQWINLPTPIEKININVRGGAILPLINPEMTTKMMRKNPILLLAALPATGGACGELLWDDGISQDSFSSGKYTKILFKADQNSFTARPAFKGYSNMSKAEGLMILGIKSKTITNVTVNGEPNKFMFSKGSLVITSLVESLMENLDITWK